MGACESGDSQTMEETDIYYCGMKRVEKKPDQNPLRFLFHVVASLYFKHNLEYVVNKQLIFN